MPPLSGKMGFAIRFVSLQLRRMKIIAWLCVALSLGACELAAAPSLKIHAEGFTSPLVLTPIPGDEGKLVVVDQIGVAYVMDKEGKRLQPEFLDLRDRMTRLNKGFDERGFLGLAFHPKFQENKKCYVYYSAPRRAGISTNYDHTSHLSEFKIGANVLAADVSSERVLLRVDQPQFNHNGGRILFGPDGYLYIGLGDGGAANDKAFGHVPEGNGQNKDTLLGKILRIDVDKGDPYGIPQDNPFANGGGRKEIFAYGFRNPWGLSFDRGGTHEFFAADVGQDAFEEINIITKGGNYGWRIREGFSCFDPDKPMSPPADCPNVGADGKPLIEPILVYKNFKRFAKDPEAKGISVTGGYVYRGKAIPELQGKYIFADWSRKWVIADGVLFSGTRGSDGKWTMEPLELASHPKGELKGYIVALAEGAEGELYVLTNGSNALATKNGKVYKLTAN